MDTTTSTQHGSLDFTTELIRSIGRRIGIQKLRFRALALVQSESPFSSNKGTDLSMLSLAVLVLVCFEKTGPGRSRRCGKGKKLVAVQYPGNEFKIKKIKTGPVRSLDPPANMDQRQSESDSGF